MCIYIYILCICNVNDMTWYDVSQTFVKLKPLVAGRPHRRSMCLEDHRLGKPRNGELCPPCNPWWEMKFQWHFMTCHVVFWISMLFFISMIIFYHAFLNVHDVFLNFHVFFGNVHDFPWYWFYCKTVKHNLKNNAYQICTENIFTVGF